jgi:hypothetical protein
MNETIYGTLKIDMLLDVPGRADYLKPTSRVMKRTLVTQHNMTREDAVLFFNEFKESNADTLETRNLHACWIPLPDWL